MKEQKYHLYLSKDEYSEVLQSLIRLKNSLIAQGRYTDAADDILCKVLSAKKRKFKIRLKQCSLLWREILKNICPLRTKLPSSATMKER